MWIFLWIFFLCFDLTVAVEIDLNTNSATVPLNQTIPVEWQVVEGDPPGLWDIRLVQHREDTGERLAGIEDQNTSGVSNITITGTEAGQWFMLVAVKSRPENRLDFEVIGNSSMFQVVQDPVASTTSDPTPASTSPSTSTTPIATSTGNNSTQKPDPEAGALDGASTRATPSSGSKTAIIAGATVGSAVFVLGALLLLAFIRRRRRQAKPPTELFFNRELMFQRRPTVHDSWTLRSLDIERGSMSESSQIHITKTMTSDRDV